MSNTSGNLRERTLDGLIALRSRIGKLGLAGLVLVLSPLSAGALQPERVAQVSVTRHAAEAPAALERTAAVNLSDVTLAEGLSALREAARVRITFSPSLLPGTRDVRCDCADVPVREALTLMLDGSGFRYSAVGAQIIIEPVEQPRAPGRLLVDPAARYPVTLASLGGGTRWRGLPAQALVPMLTGTIVGSVTEARTMRPLPAAQISVDGTGIGALADQEGRFLLPNVPAGEVIVTAQLIGYGRSQQTVQVESGATTTIGFQLTEQAFALDEIVVTGTAGQARRREVGTSIASLRAQDIEAAAVRHPQDILSGRIAGATVMANTGQPGQGGTILLRGNNSISQGNQPLIYVDGIRLFSEGGPGSTLPLNDISPDQIERVEVVRGAAATTLYGTEASSGVIQIFTRQGAAGQAQWNAEIMGGFNSLNTATSDDPTGFFIQQCRGPEMVNTMGVVFEDVTCPESGSWLQRGSIQRYSLSVQGGVPDPHITYFLSGNFNDENGVVAPGGSKNGGFRGNFTFRPSSSFQIGSNTSYSNRASRFIPDGNYLRGFLLNVMRGPANNYKIGGQPANALVLDQELTNRSEHFIMGLTANYDPSERLSHRLTVGYDYNAVENENLIPFGHQGVPLGSLGLTAWNNTTLSVDYAGSLRSSFGENVSSTFSLGGQIFENRRRSRAMSGNDFSGPGEPTLSSAARTAVGSDVRLRVINAGFFVQEMIGYADRAFLTLGLRVDGNSAFGSSFGLQPYPKVSLSYVLSDHDAWPQVFETFKLRGAVGESGKAPGAFDAVQTWSPISAENGQPAFTPGQLGNPNLGPERSREYELGFDASALAGRLTADVTYFWQRTTDALVPVTPPPSQGFLSSQLENVGEIHNSGVEVALLARLIERPGLDWIGRLNLGFNQSEVIDIGGQVINVGSGNWFNTLKEGNPVPAFIGRRIVNPDEIADPVIEEDVLLGPAYPTRNIGVGTTLNLFQGKVSFDVMGEYQGGHFQQNAVGFQNSIRGVWRPCYETQARIRAGDLSGLTARERAQCSQSSQVNHAHWWVQPADFFKLRSTSVTMQLPAERLRGVRNASLTLSARNLFTITDYDGLDPEVNDHGFGLNRQEYYNLPPARSFLVSVRVGF